MQPPIPTMEATEEFLRDKGIFVRSLYKKSNLREFPRTPGSIGLSELSKNEIKRDFRDIEKSMPVDSDSDCSFKSDDVLICTYPHKPRKSYKPAKIIFRDPTKSDAVRDKETHVILADHALNLVRAMRFSKKELFDAEEKREALEILNYSYLSAIKEKVNKFAQSKKEQESYLQLLQGLYGNRLKLQRSYAQNNMYVYDILEALKRKQESLKIIEQESQKLTSHSESQDGSAEQLSCVSTLRVRLIQSNKEVLIYKGQWLQTPVGVGQIICIKPESGSVEILLPFGTMYSNIARVVCWGGLDSALDATSEAALAKKWLQNKRCINISASKTSKIRQLVDSVDLKAATPNTLLTKLLGGYVSDDDNLVSGEDVNSNYGSFSDNEDGREEQGPSAQQVQSNVVPTLPIPATTNFTRGAAKHQSLLSGPSVFPLSTGLPSTHRSLLRKSLHDGVVGSSTKVEDLALAFAPAAALPAFISQRKKPYYRTEIFSQALLSDGTANVGSTGSLAWSGSVDDMRASLKSQLAEIKKLQGDLLHSMNEAENATSRRVRLVQDSSYLRLSAYTSRMRHRSNLAVHGVIAANPGSAVPTASIHNNHTNISNNHSSSSNNHSNGIASNPNSLSSVAPTTTHTRAAAAAAAAAAKLEATSKPIVNIVDTQAPAAELGTSRSIARAPEPSKETNLEFKSNKRTRENSIDVTPIVNTASTGRRSSRGGTSDVAVVSNSVVMQPENPVETVSSSRRATKQAALTSSSNSSLLKVNPPVSKVASSPDHVVTQESAASDVDQVPEAEGNEKVDDGDNEVAPDVDKEIVVKKKPKRPRRFF